MYTRSRSSEISRQTYKARVNYRLKFEDALAEGNYDLADSNISATSPASLVRGRHEQVFCLVHIDRRLVSRSELLVEMNKHRGLVSATTRELLAFGAEYPRFQLQFPIATPGASLSAKSQANVIPVLCGNRIIGTRYVWLQEVNQLDTETRFLALRV